jgi:CheY-like chemotaxis protein
MQGDRPLSILLVDDNPGNLLAFKAILADLGQTVLTAQSGEEALRLLIQRDFALVVLDVRMPGMDGFEVAELIRSRERTKDTPILFLTAYHKDEADIERGLALGAVDYLVKPISPDDLRGKVANILDQHTKS